MASTGLAVSATKVQAQLADVLRSKERLESRLKKVGQTTEQHVGTVVGAVEIVGAEIGLGYARGRFGEKVFVGVAWEAWAGLGLHVLGFTGLAGKHSEHLHSIGTGAIAFTAAVEGLKLGQEHRHAEEHKSVRSGQEEARQAPRPAPAPAKRTNGAPERLPAPGPTLEETIAAMQAEAEATNEPSTE